MNWGLWVDNIISFLIVAFAVFMLVRAMNNAKKKEEAAPTTKDCPHCATAIPIPATRCPHCTSEVKAA